MSDYHTVVIKFSSASAKYKEKVMGHAQEFSSFQGALEFSMDEACVDNILGSDAYCGGDITEDLLCRVEEASRLEEFGLRIFFGGDGSASDATSFVEIVSAIDRDMEISREVAPEEDWNSSWREHYAPIDISNKLKVVPEWQKQETGDHEHNIYIYPGMGFGTGEHETTYLCLKILDKMSFMDGPRTCLDFGCGSGILGIAARKIFSFDVDFCDIDENALVNCRQNIELNFEKNDQRFADKLVLRSALVPAKKYQLIFANILQNVLLQERDFILRLMDTPSSLIVSGILHDQEQGIIEAYTVSGLSVSLIERRGDWSAILFVRSSR